MSVFDFFSSTPNRLTSFSSSTYAAVPPKTDPLFQTIGWNCYKMQPFLAVGLLMLPVFRGTVKYVGDEQVFPLVKIDYFHEGTDISSSIVFSKVGQSPKMDPEVLANAQNNLHLEALVAIFTHTQWVQFWRQCGVNRR